jgi:antitoxin YefM
MAIEITQQELRRRLSSILDRVCHDQEVVIVHRREAKDVAMLPADEWSSLAETAYLLRSPRNATRLLRAVKRAQSGIRNAESLSLLKSKYPKR